MEQKLAPTRIQCPECQAVYRVGRPAAELAKMRVKCKKCEYTFTPTFPELEFSAPVAPARTNLPSPPAPAGPSTLVNPPVAQVPAPVASPPTVPQAGADPFDTLEETVGGLSRAIYEIRQQSPEAIPTNISSQVGQIADAIVGVKRQVGSLRRAGQDLENLLEVSNALNQETHLAPLLELIMDSAIKTLNAERGFLMLKNQTTGALDVSVARGMGEALADDESREFSTGIASTVANDGTPFFTANSKGDDRVAEFASVMRSDARAVLCVPVDFHERNLGTLYLDNQAGAPGFTEDLLRLAASFASASAGAIENARLYENIREETAKRSNLSRYLSPSVVDDILKQGENFELGGATIDCSVLFSDVVGFTSFSEDLTPIELVKLMNEYFTVMADAIFTNDGTLDKFIGDATMAIFGAPVHDPHHAAMAVDAGLNMLAACDKLMAKWKSEGKPTFQMRVGVNSGPVVAGNLGSPQRMDYTVIGDAVNLASRMESSSEAGTLCISEYTWDLIKDFAKAEDKGPIKVKGKSDEIRVFHVFSIEPPRQDAHHIERTSPRAVTEIFTIYSQEGIDGTRQGIIRDLSEGGAMAHSGFAAEAGNLVKLNFSLPSGEQVKEISAVVVRVSSIEDEGAGFQINLKFVDMDENSRTILGTYVHSQIEKGAD
ncbi:MAG: GAF domain-containing protein [Nitrospinaceae bacterium]|nr:GAF domain-containing protein [Nitrospinaceae bacterium]MBT3432563.1 GAF domain-containing protein [Nitrospinaceae bacterium]MBT4430264.1 GAF domain-containing protein [Nitrospinaceae bacterium]MBT5368075.1 GAF domain-containing protein [Nitrospinaceae bacterium]MBT5946107.1 GAF domain-containing protein [Nitrospinaceae bacterium]